MGLGNWLRRRFGGTPQARSLPPDSTGDRPVSLPPTCTPEQIVDYVLSRAEPDLDPSLQVAHLAATAAVLSALYGLSVEGAVRAIDRVGRGVVLARTGNPDNCPDRAKDPIAWASFQRVFADRAQR